jgi:hypothetical protein
MMDQITLAIFTVIGAGTLLLVIGVLNRPPGQAVEPSTKSGALRLSIGFASNPAPRSEHERPHGDQRAQPRWLQKIKANQGGYFWLPCHICGEPYGGHESAGTEMVTPSRGRSVCANCVDEAARRSDAMYQRHGYVLDPNPPCMKDQRGEWVPIRQWIDPRWLASFATPPDHQAGDEHGE